MDINDNMAAAPGPLACPSRGARPPSLSKPQRSAPLPFLAAALGPESVLTLPNPTHILILLKIDDY